MTAENVGTGGILAQFSEHLAQIVERAGQATVAVHARRRLPASGIIWDDSGYIVTANHVVQRDDDITVGLPNGTTVPATLVGRASGADLAVLKVETGTQTNGGAGITLTPATKAVNAPRVGHLTVAVGRPGTDVLASSGIISIVGGPWRLMGGQTVEGFVRAEVTMLPGFSGGPLIDAWGHVIGLNTSGLGRDGGITIPHATIDRIVAMLKEHGRIRRAFLGIATQPTRITESLQQSLGLTQQRGLLLVGLDPDGPAERDGLLIGDVLIGLDDRTIEDTDALQDALGQATIGQALTVKVIRGGAVQSVTVSVGERP